MEVIQTHAQCGNVASTLPMKSVLHCPRDIQHAVHLERKHECQEECACGIAHEAITYFTSLHEA